MIIKAFRVTKSKCEPFDAHKVGAMGHSIGKVQHPHIPEEHLHIVFWDDAPGIPVVCSNTRLTISEEAAIELSKEAISHLAPYKLLMDQSIRNGHNDIVTFHSENIFS
jgi:hypothetical protein